MAKFKFKGLKNINIGRVVAKLVAVIIGLYVGNEIITQLGAVLNGTEGGFNPGFKLIGWTVGGYPAYNATNYYADCAATTIGGTTQNGTTCISSVAGAGVLSVIGLIGLASIVMEFVEFNL